MKFFPHSSGKSHQTFTFATVKDHIVNQVMRTFDEGADMAETLKKEKYKDLERIRPTRKLSAIEEAEARKIEQDGLDMLYKAELDEWMKRKRTFETNTTKAYGVIYNYCNKTMQCRIEEHPEFETKIENDPVELLKAIKVLMHDPVRARYP